MTEIEALVNSSKMLPPVSTQAAREYAEKSNQLVERVNQLVTAQENIAETVGHNPLEIAFNNHSNHAAFIANILEFNSAELLARTLPWVYRSYHARGFTFDYFPLVIKSFCQAVDETLPPALAREIRAFYQWILNQHPLLIQLAQAGFPQAWSVENKWQQTRNLFAGALLAADHQQCLQLAENFAPNTAAVPDFYQNVIQPALYDIGDLWEKGAISVAEEHLATAIATRVMAALVLRLTPHSQNKDTAVVTASPNEFHEVGAWMVADILQYNGWNVRYLGANTPTPSLIEFLSNLQPLLLAVSVTMPFNLSKTKSLITAVRREPSLKDLKIVVGGLAFRQAPQIWQVLGADAYAREASQVLELADNWFKKGEQQ